MRPITVKRLLLALGLCLSTALAMGFSMQSALYEGRIAFGSGLQQWKPQPVWKTIVELEPQAFIFLGDNVYSDVDTYKKLDAPLGIRQAYRDQEKNKDFRYFGQKSYDEDISVYATWNDHDYGEANGGGDYAYKVESREYFADFFGLNAGDLGDGLNGTFLNVDVETPDAGVYHAKYLDIAGLTIQLILLDTRSFRSPLSASAKGGACPWAPSTGSDATLLGDAQWKWLEAELGEEADMRIIASSIQVLPTEHCFEKWANFPAERQRLLELIKTGAHGGVILLSGDRQLAEISRLDDAVGYPLYEVTASGLNSAVGKGSALSTEPNALRTTENNVVVDNFGMIKLHRKEDTTPVVQLQIRDLTGAVLQEETFDLGELYSAEAKAAPRKKKSVFSRFLE